MCLTASLFHREEVFRLIDLHLQAFSVGVFSRDGQAGRFKVACELDPRREILTLTWSIEMRKRRVLGLRPLRGQPHPASLPFPYSLRHRPWIESELQTSELRSCVQLSSFLLRRPTSAA